MCSAVPRRPCCRPPNTTGHEEGTTRLPRKARVPLGASTAAGHAPRPGEIRQAPGRAPRCRCDRRTRTSSRSTGRAPRAGHRRGRDRSTSPGRPRWCRWSAGAARCSIDSSTATASIAPAAPSGWPVAPFVDVTMGPGCAEDLGDRLCLRGVVQGRGGAVGVHVDDLARADAGVDQRHLHAGDGAGAAGRRGGDVVRVGRAGRSEDFSVDVGAAGLGHLELLQQEDSGALRQDEAVAVGIEGSAETARCERRHVAEPGHRRERDAALGAAGEHGVAAVPGDEPRAA